MDRKRYQFSLASLLLLTTACAVLLSLAKTFPEASAVVATFALKVAGLLLFFWVSLMIYYSELFFPGGTRFLRVYVPLAGLFCIIAGLLFFFLH